MQSDNKPLNFVGLGLMSVAIAASLQIMTSCAIYGSSLLFFYLVAVLTFFLPCILMIAELTTSSPVTGGSYVWVAKAFGKSWGFFAVCIQWLCNLIWYPTIFSLIATSLAYLIAPELASNKAYILTGTLALFWGITLLNCLGIRISSFVSSLGALLGIVLPTLILIGFGIVWMVQGNPSQVSFDLPSLLPDFGHPEQFAFLTQIIISLIGIEMAFVHAGDVQNPAKSIPKALALSGILTLFIVISAPLAIAVVIPSSEISVIAGLFDAFQAFFGHFGLSPVVYSCILGLIVLGNCGNVTAWMISATRGMHVANQECQMPPFLQKTNRFNAPMGVLIVEAIIFSICATLFLFFDNISSAYWILLTLACQVALIYYLLIFFAAVKLKKTHPKENSFLIPGGIKGTACAATLGTAATLSAIVLGFFPPEQGEIVHTNLYPFLLALGVLAILAIPLLFLKLRSKQAVKALNN